MVKSVFLALTVLLTSPCSVAGIEDETAVIQTNVRDGRAMTAYETGGDEEEEGANTRPEPRFPRSVAYAGGHGGRQHKNLQIGTVVMVGDSGLDGKGHTWGQVEANLAEFLGTTVVNNAVGGAKISDVLNNQPACSSKAYDADCKWSVIMAGMNPGGNISMEDFVERERDANKFVIILGHPDPNPKQPGKVKWWSKFQDKYRDLVANSTGHKHDKGVWFLDMREVPELSDPARALKDKYYSHDGSHPSTKAGRLFAGLIAHIIRTEENDGKELVFEDERGCHRLETEEACIAAVDGRSFFNRAPCNWCCGEECTKESGVGGRPNKCEPQSFLLRQRTYNGKSKNAFESTCDADETWQEKRIAAKTAADEKWRKHIADKKAAMEEWAADKKAEWAAKQKARREEIAFEADMAKESMKEEGSPYEAAEADDELIIRERYVNLGKGMCLNKPLVDHPGMGEHPPRRQFEMANSAECEAACSEETLCSAYDFNKKIKTCQTFGKNSPLLEDLEDYEIIVGTDGNKDDPEADRACKKRVIHEYVRTPGYCAMGAFTGGRTSYGSKWRPRANVNNAQKKATNSVCLVGGMGQALTLNYQGCQAKCDEEEECGAFEVTEASADAFESASETFEGAGVRGSCCLYGYSNTGDNNVDTKQGTEKRACYITRTQHEEDGEMTRWAEEAEKKAGLEAAEAGAIDAAAAAAAADAAEAASAEAAAAAMAAEDGDAVAAQSSGDDEEGGNETESEESTMDKISAMCFPGTAVVRASGRGNVQLSDLHVGDNVLVKSGRYEPVLGFLHAVRHKSSDFVTVAHSSGEFRASANHIVFANNGVDMLVANVQVGDQLFVADGKSMVLSVRRSVGSEGMFAPFTASGTIVVDGVVASNYAASSTTLALPHGAAHAVLFPARMFHGLTNKQSNVEEVHPFLRAVLGPLSGLQSQLVA